MSGVSVMLYFVVFVVAILGLKSFFSQSKKAAYITLLVSPFYLFVSHFISPYINWRGKFDGLFRFLSEMGFSDQGAVGARYVILFILFWVIFFSLSAFTFKFIVKKTQETKSEQ